MTSAGGRSAVTASARWSLDDRNQFVVIRYRGRGQTKERQTTQHNVLTASFGTEIIFLRRYRLKSTVFKLHAAQDFVEGDSSADKEFC